MNTRWWVENDQPSDRAWKCRGRCTECDWATGWFEPVFRAAVERRTRKHVHDTHPTDMEARLLRAELAEQDEAHETGIPCQLTECDHCYRPDEWDRAQPIIDDLRGK